MINLNDHKIWVLLIFIIENYGEKLYFYKCKVIISKLFNFTMKFIIVKPKLFQTSLIGPKVSNLSVLQ